MSTQHAPRLIGGPQNGWPKKPPITPPATAPTGPATSKPEPAPAAAPTMSACAAGEIVATVMIVASASICWRIAFSPTTSPACAELKSPSLSDCILGTEGGHPKTNVRRSKSCPKFLAPSPFVEAGMSLGPRGKDDRAWGRNSPPVSTPARCRPRKWHKAKPLVPHGRRLCCFDRQPNNAPETAAGESK